MKTIKIPGTNLILERRDKFLNNNSKDENDYSKKES